MDYQAWLKVFGVELSHQKPSVAVDDLDPLYLQSLFQHGTSPIQAVNKALVLRGYKIDRDGALFCKAFTAVRWDYLIPAAAFVAVAFLVMQSKNTIAAKEEAPPTPVRTVIAPKSNGDFFALGDIAFATSYASNFIQARGTPPQSRVIVHTAVQRGQSVDSPAATAPLGSADDSPAGSTASLDTASSADLPVVQITTTRNGGGSPSPVSTAPNIQSFQVNTTGTDSQGYVGLVTWTVTNGQSVQLLLQGQQIAGASGLVSTIPFTGLPEGAVFTLRVTNNGKIVEQNAMVEPPSLTGAYQPGT